MCLQVWRKYPKLLTMVISCHNERNSFLLYVSLLNLWHSDLLIFIIKNVKIQVQDDSPRKDRTNLNILFNLKIFLIGWVLLRCFFFYFRNYYPTRTRVTYLIILTASKLSSLRNMPQLRATYEGWILRTKISNIKFKWVRIFLFLKKITNFHSTLSLTNQYLLKEHSKGLPRH